jgi:hypothetical protein
VANAISKYRARVPEAVQQVRELPRFVTRPQSTIRTHSTTGYNETIVAPVTRTIRGLTTEVLVSNAEGMPAPCALNFDQSADDRREHRARSRPAARPRDHHHVSCVDPRGAGDEQRARGREGRTRIGARQGVEGIDARRGTSTWPRNIWAVACDHYLFRGSSQNFDGG